MVPGRGFDPRPRPYQGRVLAIVTSRANLLTASYHDPGHFWRTVTGSSLGDAQHPAGLLQGVDSHDHPVG